MTTETSNDAENQPRKFKIHPDLERLVELQKLDTQILRKQKILAALPQEIKRGYANCEAAKAALKAFDATLEADSKKRRDLERGVEELKEKIIKDKSKLPSVKTNVEYTAINKELANYAKQIDQLEEEELLLMEAADGRQEERKAFVARLEEEEKSFAVVKREKEAGIKALEADLEELIGVRKSTNAAIDPQLLASYEKLLKARDGVGVARAQDSVCSACHQAIQRQLYYNVRDSGELITCPHCSRYLYYQAETPEEL